MKHGINIVIFPGKHFAIGIVSAMKAKVQKNFSSKLFVSKAQKGIQYLTIQSVQGGRGSVLVRAQGKYWNRRESHSVHTDSMPLLEANNFVIEKVMNFYSQNYTKEV